MEPIFDVKKTDSIKDLVDQFKDVGGFTAAKVYTARRIWNDMQKENCFKFLSFPSCLIATGIRGVIKDLVKDKKVDLIITTAGTVALDFIRCYRDFYKGSFMLDDKELRKKHLFRLGSVIIKEEDYGAFLEDKLQPYFEKLYSIKKSWPTYELIWKVGEFLEKDSSKKEESILYWAYKNKIPIIVPGITDGAFGSQLWQFWQDHKDFSIDLFSDEQLLADIVFKHKKTGALILGGGISKHHTIWWNQFKDGLDYAVYITTAPEYDGSLSGARMREAISWGKLSENAKYVTVEGDATLILPLIV